MRKPSKRRFHAADEDRHIAVSLANPIAIHNDRAVGTKPNFAFGRIIILAAAFFGGRIVRHHGIHVARTDHKAESGSSKHANALTAAVLVAVFVIGLGNNADRKAGIL